MHAVPAMNERAHSPGHRHARAATENVCQTALISSARSCRSSLLSSTACRQAALPLSNYARHSLSVSSAHAQAQKARCKSTMCPARQHTTYLLSSFTELKIQHADVNICCQSCNHFRTSVAVEQQYLTADIHGLALQAQEATLRCGYLCQCQGLPENCGQAASSSGSGRDATDITAKHIEHA